MLLTRLHRTKKSEGGPNLLFPKGATIFRCPYEPGHWSCMGGISGYYLAMETKTKPRYLDRPEILEQFADSVRGITNNGHTVHIELCIERNDYQSLAAPNCSSPMCRLVLTPEAAVELRDKLSVAIRAPKRKP